MACTLELENGLRAEGWVTIVGVDEAGRGPLAGPVMAGAVVLPEGYSHPWLNDSKKLSEAKREVAYVDITEDAGVHWAVGTASVEEIDRVNILNATYLAMGRAIEGLGISAQIALVDGRRVKGLEIPHRAIIKGDGLSLSIAAASVIAKVERDRVMNAFALKYPEYGFERHKGYGTKRHLDSLAKNGVTPIHRRSFRPVAECSVLFDG